MQKLCKLGACLLPILAFALLSSICTPPVPELLEPLRPTSAGGSGEVITRRVYLQNLSTYNAPLGGVVEVRGYILKYDFDLKTWVHANGEELRPFIDGVQQASVGFSSGTGNFSLPFTVPTDWAVTQSHTLIADIPNASPERSVVYNDTQVFGVFTDSKISVSPKVLEAYYLLGDPVPLTGNLSSASVPTHRIPNGNINFSVNGAFITEFQSNPSGEFQFQYFIGVQNPIINLSFGGMAGDYMPASMQASLKLFKPGDVVIKSITFPNTTYEGASITINGTLVLESDGSTPIANRRILVTVNNASIEVSTNAQGEFIARLTVPSGTGAQDFRVDLLYANGVPSGVGVVRAAAIIVSSQFDPTNPENPVPYSLIGTMVGVIIAIIVVFFLIRKGFIQLHRARPVYETSQKTMMDRVNALVEMGRITEAMAYLLVKYLDALSFRMQLKRKRGQTVRDIATEAVRRQIHRAEVLYPWTSYVEAAVYSGRAVTVQDFERSRTYFTAAQELVPFSEQEMTSSVKMVEANEATSESKKEQILSESPKETKSGNTPDAT